MGRLAGRRVVLGVSGGIAAYKAVELCRRLVEAGAHVVPVLTVGARRFVGEVTFSALASEKAQSSLWDEADPVPHTALGQGADLVVVAPATAHLLAAYAAGLADDLLTATLLATRAPVVLCPAMHTEMWEHPAVRANVATLRARGVGLCGPAAGRLAGGDDGLGRMAEPADIVAAAEAALAPRDLAGRRVLVTAGGTREPIDAVRYIANRSSGRQGHALADEAAARGAEVLLVTASALAGPAGSEVVRVSTAAEMEVAVLARSAGCDAVVMAAAVADFRPKAPAEGKLAKADGVPDIVLEPTPDIVAEVVRRRPPGQVVVCFAAEATGGGGELRRRAAAKLAAKGADLIVANDITRPGAGFESETNEVVIIDRAGGEVVVPMASKRAVASVVVDQVVAALAVGTRTPE